MANKYFNYEGETGPQVIQASNDLGAHEMFGNKTLKLIGKEFSLSDEDVQWAYTTLKDGTEARHLSLMVKGAEYIIPFSRGAKANELSSLKTCVDNNWLFRTGHMSVKDDDGAPLTDPDTGVIILDMTKPYMSLGLPGLNITRRETAWSDEPEDDLGADAATAKTVVTAKPLTAAQKQAEQVKKARAAKERA